MTLKEYSKLLEKIQSQVDIITNPAIVKPMMTIQTQLKQLYEPFMVSQKIINQSIEPLRLALEQYKNISLAFSQRYNSQIAGLIQAQQKIIENIKVMNLDLPAIEISPKTASKFTETSLNIVNEPIIEELLPEELEDSKEEISKLSKQKKPLTWKQIIDIIMFIIALITFIQAQLPNRQLTNIENSLHNIESSFQRLIEIQEEELNLLKQSQK
nr:hypothetical protein [Clostridia bacterium]